MKAVQASRRYAVRPVPLAFLRGYVGVAVSVEAMRRLKVYSSVQTNLDTAWHFLNLAPILHLLLCISITSIGNVGKDICEGVERQNKRYACHTIHVIERAHVLSAGAAHCPGCQHVYRAFFFIYTISPPSLPSSLALNTRLHNCTFSQPGCAEAVCRTDAMLCARGRTPSRSVALSTSDHVLVRSL